MDIYKIHNKLFNLIKEHNFDDFKKEIDKLDEDFDVNIRDNTDNYLLTYAILFNKLDIVKLLLTRGAVVDILDQEERSILFIPIRYGYNDILKNLLEDNSNKIGISIVNIRDKKGNIPLHYAIMHNNLNAIKLLLKHDSNVNIFNDDGLNSLHIAVYTKKLDICQEIIKSNINLNSKNKNGESALHIAVSLESDNIVEELLNNGINTDIQDNNNQYTALHYAININNRNIFNMIINKNPNVNIQDIMGFTALHYAVLENNIYFVSKLCSLENINVNLWNINGKIPLHIVFDNDYDNVDDYLNLLLKDTNINIQDNTGNTCLHHICKFNLWRNDLLLNKKLDILILNKEKKRPFDYIKEKDIDEFLDIVTKSYINRLRIKSKEIEWTHEWDNMCKKELLLTDNITPEIKKLLKKNTPKNTDICPIIIKKRLQEIINDDKKICKYKTFPTKHEYMCITAPTDNDVNICTFTGSTLDIMIGLIYLLKKFNYACSTVSKNFVDSKEICKFYSSVGVVMNSRCEFLNFEIIWVHNKIFFSDEFFDNFKKCLNKESVKFIIIPIGIEMREGSHANYLIYDKQNNEFERFEPHGSTFPIGLNYQPELLDTTLKLKLTDIVDDFTYYSPKDYLPKIGFQIMDSYETKKKRIGDPGGFCALWSIWYVDMRLTYKDISRKKLVKYMIRNLKEKNVSFRNMIRNYASNIIKIRDDLLNQADMDINDWINDDYSESQLENFLTYIKGEINKITN